MVFVASTKYYLTWFWIHFKKDWFLFSEKIPRESSWNDISLVCLVECQFIFQELLLNDVNFYLNERFVVFIANFSFQLISYIAYDLVRNIS